jgi:alpha-glucosidase
LPIDQRHLERAALDEAARPDSIYNEFADFLRWRKEQPALMCANTMSDVTGGAKQIVFDRISEQQTLRCTFDFESLTATFEEI